MTTKAVLFDLDGTLYDRDALVTRVFNQQYDAFADELAAIARDIFVRQLLDLDDRGYRDKRDAYRMAGQEWGWPSTLCDRLYDDFSARYDQHCVLDADVRHTLETLLARRIKLAVVTNGGAERQQRKLDALGITGWLDAVLISEVEGVRKPEVEIFHRALSRCGVGPSEALFVGDHPDIDIGGALRAGIPAVWKVVPYWSCPHDVPFVRRLSEILPLCDGKPTASSGG